MFLAATALEETWDYDDELLFLGPWCTRYDRKDSLKPLRYRMLPDPWGDPKDRLRGYREAMAAYEKALAWLGPRLNAIHREERSQRYWRILVGPWLVLYCHVLRDRYEHIRSAYNRYPGITTVRLDASCRIMTRDYAQLSNGTFDDGYNLQLYSQVLDALGLAGRTITYNIPALPVASFGSGFIHKLTEPIRKFYDWPIWLNDLSMSRRDQAAIFSSLIPSAWPCQPSLPELVTPSKPDASLRGPLLDFPASGEFERVLAYSLAQNMPWLYLERYKDLIRSIDQRQKHTPKVIASTSGWYDNEPFKASAALGAERGARLVAIQHGGGYGMYALIWEEALERSISDSFWCWGWAPLDGDNRLRNVPSPTLSPRSRAGPVRVWILMVAHMQVLHSHGLHSQACGSRFEEYLADRHKFLSLMPEAIRDKICVRFTKHDCGWKQRERLLEAFPKLQAETAPPSFADSLARSQLAIFDHPATTFLEAFAADVPTLLFWRKEIWDMRPQAEPFFEDLRSAGILHDSPEAAAKAFEEISADPRAWWDAPDVRQARDNFRRQFAWGDTDWKEKWRAALEEELGLADQRHVIQ